MKLAEALIERKSLTEKIAKLRQRLDENVLVQEGDRPAEQPESLMQELNEAIDQLETLIKRINATNIQARLSDGTSVADAVVRRDMIRLRREAIEQAANSASLRQSRYSRSEVRLVPTVNSAELHDQVDSLSRAWRELDAQIQAINWMTDLVS
jgi:DNA repair exonuclease SbcCD ATPase subunit